LAIECPNCKLPTVTEKKVYIHKKPDAIITIESKAENEKLFYARMTDELPYESGDISFNIQPFNIPTQIVYSCSNCGYTKVYDIPKKKEKS